MSQLEPPPLAPPEARAILRRLGDLTDEIVLVGGQALAFWAELYAERFEFSHPVNSRDIDFGGRSAVVAVAADRLNGTWTIPEPFSVSPNSGLVLFNDSEGHTRRIDFLNMVFGLDLDEIFDMAIDVEAPDHDETTRFRVMHPGALPRSTDLQCGRFARLQDSSRTRASSCVDPVRA